MFLHLLQMLTLSNLGVIRLKAAMNNGGLKSFEEVVMGQKTIAYLFEKLIGDVKSMKEQIEELTVRLSTAEAALAAQVEKELADKQELLAMIQTLQNTLSESATQEQIDAANAIAARIEGDITKLASD
jgi:hypothetical protein